MIHKSRFSNYLQPTLILQTYERMFDLFTLMQYCVNWTIKLVCFRDLNFDGIVFNQIQPQGNVNVILSKNNFFLLYLDSLRLTLNLIRTEMEFGWNQISWDSHHKRLFKLNFISYPVFLFDCRLTLFVWSLFLYKIIKLRSQADYSNTLRLHNLRMKSDKDAIERLFWKPNLSFYVTYFVYLNTWVSVFYFAKQNIKARYL